MWTTPLGSKERLIVSPACKSRTLRSAAGNAREVAVDPSTGNVLATRDPDRSLVTLFYDFHTRMWLGEAGRWIILTLAGALLGLIVSGLVVWSRRTGRWLRHLAPRLRRGRRVRDLHALLALYRRPLRSVRGRFPRFRAG